MTAATPSPLKALFTQTIYLAYPTGAVSGQGERTYGASTAVSAHVYEKQVTTWSPGQQEKRTATFVCTDAVIAEDTRIWLPGVSSADATLSRLPRSIEHPRDETGALWAYVAEV